MRNVFAAAFTAATLLLLAGCASVKPVAASNDSVAALQGQALTIVTYNPKAEFMQMTWGEGGFALIGAAVAASNSRDLVDKYDLVNPSVQVAELMKPVLGEKFRPAAINPVADGSDGGKSLSDLAALAGHKGLVFDVAGGSMSIYFPLDFTHYKVIFNGSGRLVDAGTAKVVAEAQCHFDTSDEKNPATYVANPPSYDELYADNARLLKAKFQSAASACVAQMNRSMFGG